MQFLWPQNLWLLWVVPALVALYVYAQRRRRKYALRYASLSLVREALGRGPGIRRHVPPALYLVALTAMLVAFARPVSVVSLPSQEGVVILAMDVSGSMQADDIKPNRLEAAKAAAKTFVERQHPNVRIGIVSFSTDASIVQAPTIDRDAVIAAIDRLRPQRATAIGRAILTSLDAIFEGSDEELPSAILRATEASPSPSPKPKPPRLKGQYAPASIILLTDGQNNQFPLPLAIVDEATNRGVRVYTVGLGTIEGTILRIQGRAIRTRLDEATLKKIAELTEAQYFNAANETELQKVYENLTTELVIRTEKTEITALFTALAALLSLLGGALSLVWFSRLP